VNNLLSQRCGVPFRQCFCPRSFHFATAVHTTPENVVLAPRVDSNVSPHLVIVGQQSHPRCPDDIQDREIVRAVERFNLPSLRLAQFIED
jgi:hypothetical protein